MKNFIVSHKINCLMVEEAIKFYNKSLFSANMPSSLNEQLYLPLKRDTNCGTIKVNCKTCKEKSYSSATVIDDSVSWILENEQQHLSCLQWEFINLDCHCKLFDVFNCKELVDANISQKVICNVLINKLENVMSCSVIAGIDYQQQCNIIEKISNDSLCEVDKPQSTITNRVCDIIINELK